MLAAIEPSCDWSVQTSLFNSGKTCCKFIFDENSWFLFVLSPYW